MSFHHALMIFEEAGLSAIDLVLELGQRDMYDAEDVLDAVEYLS